MSVCLWVGLYGRHYGVRQHISGTSRPNLTTFSVPLAMRYVLPVLWMTSGLRSSYGIVTLPQQPRCNVAYELTPLLQSIDSVLSYTTSGFKTRRVHLTRGIRAKSAMHHCLVTWSQYTVAKHCTVCVSVCPLA